MRGNRDFVYKGTLLDKQIPLSEYSSVSTDKNFVYYRNLFGSARWRSG